MSYGYNGYIYIEKQGINKQFHDYVHTGSFQESWNVYPVEMTIP